MIILFVLLDKFLIRMIIVPKGLPCLKVLVYFKVKNHI